MNIDWMYARKAIDPSTPSVRQCDVYVMYVYSSRQVFGECIGQNASLVLHPAYQSRITDLNSLLDMLNESDMQMKR